MNRGLGFTLIELMITVTILGIVVAFAAPSFSQFIDDTRNREAGRQLFGTLNFMRATAVSRQATVSFCPSSNDDTCGDNWHDGGIIFEDQNKDGKRDAGEPLLRVFNAMPAGSVLQRNPKNKNFIRYRPSGQISFTGNFSYCPPNGDAKSGWIIVINQLGRPYYGKDKKGGDGIVEDGSGKALSCDN